MSAAVVKLPTAARRQVQQRWNKHTRPVAMEMRDKHAGRFPFMRPEEREVAHLADFMVENPLTPEMRILLVLIQTLDLDHDARLKLSLGTVGDPVAHKIVELAFADQHKTFAIQSLLRRRGLQ